MFFVVIYGQHSQGHTRQGTEHNVHHNGWPPSKMRRILIMLIKLIEISPKYDLITARLSPIVGYVGTYEPSVVLELVVFDTESEGADLDRQIYEQREADDRSAQYAPEHSIQCLIAGTIKQNATTWARGTHRN